MVTSHNETLSSLTNLSKEKKYIDSNDVCVLCLELLNIEKTVRLCYHHTLHISCAGAYFNFSDTNIKCPGMCCNDVDNDIRCACINYIEEKNKESTFDAITLLKHELSHINLGNLPIVHRHSTHQDMKNLLHILMTKNDKIKKRTRYNCNVS
jgi:hypothetical protein